MHAPMCHKIRCNSLALTLQLAAPDIQALLILVSVHIGILSSAVCCAITAQCRYRPAGASYDTLGHATIRLLEGF